MAEFEAYEEAAAQRKYQCSDTGVFVVMVAEHREANEEFRASVGRDDPDVLNHVRALGAGDSLSAAFGLLKEWWKGAPRAVQGQLPPSQMYRIVLMDISPDDGRGEIREAQDDQNHSGTEGDVPQDRRSSFSQERRRG